MFAKEKINTGRQPELDIARGLAVLFMILIHVQLYFASTDTLDSYFADFNDFVGDIPAAPMFMFLLGVGINYTRKNNPTLMFKRGIMLILTGYFLNFIRGFVPSIINAYNFADPTYLYIGMTELLYVDILQFSGLAMIMFGIFTKFHFRNTLIAFTGLVFACLNLLLLNIPVDHFLFAALSGLFWGSNEFTFFPFLTWAFYPIAGFLFGSLLIRCTNKKRFYGASALLGSFAFFAGTYVFNILLKLPSGLTTDLGYYHHTITDNITFTGFVILEISLLSLITPFIPKALQGIINRWSKNVTSIFCIHWVLLTWATLFIPQHSLDMLPFGLLLILIILLSDLFAYLYSNRKSNQNVQQLPVVIPILLITLIASLCSITVLSNTQKEESNVSPTKYVDNMMIDDYLYTGTINMFTGEPTGNGTAYYANGDYYEGEFKDGLLSGQGNFIGADGEQYIGSFAKDEYNGYGEYMDPDGSTYTGEFVDGEFNGEGTFINPDGTIERGIWKDGALISE